MFSPEIKEAVKAAVAPALKHGDATARISRADEIIIRVDLDTTHPEYNNHGEFLPNNPQAVVKVAQALAHDPQYLAEEKKQRTLDLEIAQQVTNFQTSVLHKYGLKPGDENSLLPLFSEEEKIQYRALMTNMLIPLQDLDMYQKDAAKKKSEELGITISDHDLENVARALNSSYTQNNTYTSQTAHIHSAQVTQKRGQAI